MQHGVRILLGRLPRDLVLGAQPLTQPLASMAFHGSVGFADRPETEVVRPPNHRTVELRYHHSLVQQDLIPSGHLTIDLCINNAIMGVREGNTYAQTEGERRSVRGPAQASFGTSGFRPLSERSGSAHPMPCQFGDALAGDSAARWSQGFAGALLSGATAEAGAKATK